jgi:type VI secretion system secreted protein Hcp
MAFDTFLKIDGVTGESTRSGFEGQIEVYSFSFGGSNPSTVGSAAGGGGAGKATINSFSIMKKTESSSVPLFQQMCVGKHFATGTVTLNKASGDKTTPLPFIKYEFTTIFIDSIQWSGSTGGDDSPTESVSMSFGKVKMTYTPQKADGSPGTPQVASYDITKGEAS